MSNAKCSHCDGLGKTVMGVNLNRLGSTTRQFYKDKLSDCKVCGGTGLVSTERSYYSYDPNVAISMLRQTNNIIIRIDIPEKLKEEVWVTFSDGSKYVIGGFSVGHSGDRPSNFKIFLDQAGFSISYDEIVAMCPPVILEPPNKIMRMVTSVADTVVDVSTIALNQLNEGEEIISEKQNAPSQRMIQVQAFDEKAAKIVIKKEIDTISRIVEIKLKATGKKGLLGIGKKPNTYEACILTPAYVELAVVKRK